MNKGRTSTKNNTQKKVNKNVKTSTSPSSAKPKKVVQTKKVVKKAPQQVKKKPINDKQPVKRPQPKKVEKEVIKPDINIVDVEEYREANEEKRTKNNIRAPKKEEKKESKFHIKSTTVLKISFYIAGLVAILFLMFNLEFFNLQDIKVENNIKYSNDEIIKSTSLNIGENVFKQLFFKDKIKDDLPYVYRLRFGYTIPDGITVYVEERFPAYIVKDKNTSKCYLLDNEGVILEECLDSQRKDELLIEGFVLEKDIKAGDKLDEVYLNKIKIYHQIKELLEASDITGKITQVKFSGSLTTIYLDGKLKVVFANDSNLSYKVSFLKSIINENGGSLEGIIDMSVENPVYSKYD